MPVAASRSRWVPPRPPLHRPRHMETSVGMLRRRRPTRLCVQTRQCPPTRHPGRLVTLPGPTKTDCPCGCPKFGTPRKSTGHIRDCICERCAAGQVRQPMSRTRRTSTGWQAARREALRRTAGRCEVGSPWCEPGVHWAVHVHHRLPRSAGGSDVPDNLLALCAAAHRGCHAYPVLAYERGWLLSRYP